MAMIDELQERLRGEMGVQGSTKRSSLRLALIGLIRDGVLQPDARIPAEVELAKAVGLSLGTVQSALGQLQDMGLVVRRRGEGTRVAGRGPIAPSVWHFRFRVLATRQPLMVLDQEIELFVTPSMGPWSEHLGQASRYIVIRRAMNATDGIRMGAEMYLDDSFSSLLEMNPREFQSTNLRSFIEEKFSVVASRVSHEVDVEAMAQKQAALFGMREGHSCFRLEARTFMNDMRPFYYQRIYASVEDVSLTF